MNKADRFDFFDELVLVVTKRDGSYVYELHDPFGNVWQLVDKSEEPGVIADENVVDVPCCDDGVNS